MLRTGDKHAGIRVALAEIFHSNYRFYGYRRLHAMFRHEGIRLSEKVVRRLMSVEKLICTVPVAGDTTRTVVKSAWHLTICLHGILRQHSPIISG